MAGVLAELITRIIADNARFNRETEKSEKKVESFERRMVKMGHRLAAIGAQMTKFVTLPIIGLGVAMVKSASDLGESINAVNVTFGASGKIITDWSQNASKEVGLTATEINSAATNIGAILLNMGFYADTAAAETIKLTRRAADMASVFNTDVKTAIDAIASGLRGQSEPLTKYGVSLLEANVNATALAEGITDGKEAMDQSQKTLARLATLYKDTDRFAGDFVNTSESLANSTRILFGDLKNVGAELGQKLIPIVTVIVSKIRDLVSRFSELSPEMQTNKILLLAIGAAAGPVLAVFGRLLTILPAMKVAIAAMTGPAGILAAGLAVLAAATVRIVQQFREAKNEQEQVKAGLEGLIPTVGEYDRVVAREVADLQELNRQRAVQQESLNRYLSEAPRDLVMHKDQQAAIARTTALIVSQMAVITQLETNRDNLSKNQTEATERERAALQAQIDVQRQLVDESAALLAADEAAEQQRQLIADQEEARAEAQLNDIIRVGKADQALYELQLDLMQQRLDWEKKILDDLAAYELAAEQQHTQQLEAFVKKRRDDTMALVNALGNLWGSFYDLQLADVDEEARRRKKNTDALLANDKLTADQREDILDQQLADEATADKARRKIQRESAIASKLMAAFNIIINTAQAITSALTLPIGGRLLAGINAAIGAAQLATVLAQPLPKLATGGVHSGPAIVGEGGGPELALPLTDSRALDNVTTAFERALAQRHGGGRSESAGDQQIILTLDGVQIGKALGRLTRNGQLLVDSRAVVA